MRKPFTDKDGNLIRPDPPSDRELDGTVMKRMKKMPRASKRRGNRRND